MTLQRARAQHARRMGCLFLVLRFESCLSAHSLPLLLVTTMETGCAAGWVRMARLLTHPFSRTHPATTPANPQMTTWIHPGRGQPRPHD